VDRLLELRERIRTLETALVKARDAMVRVGDSEYVPAQELVDEFEAVLAGEVGIQRSKEWWIANAQIEGDATVLAGGQSDVPTRYTPRPERHKGCVSIMAGTYAYLADGTKIVLCRDKGAKGRVWIEQQEQLRIKAEGQPDAPEWQDMPPFP
jgi:hypothetical protein